MNILDTTEVHLGCRGNLFVPLFYDTRIMKGWNGKDPLHVEFGDPRPLRRKKS
jgi:hypothetical protein